MSQHIPDALLTQFVDGDLEEPVAVAVAKHLDSCSMCASAARAKEPLSYHFAQTDDPHMPPELLARIHAGREAQQEDASASRGQADSIAFFLAAAAVLLAIIISPLGFIEGTQDTLSGLAARSEATLGRGMSIGLAAGFVLGLTVAFIVRRKKTRESAPRS